MKIVQKINVSDFLQLARVEDPDVVVIMPSSSKGGIMEKYIKVFRKTQIAENHRKVYQGFQKNLKFVENCQK